jgi:ribonuclease P protein component
MLPKEKRLNANDFKGLKSRIAYRGTLFDMSVMPSQTTKFACVIAKKRIKRAVDRNTAKRKVYALLHDVKLSSPAYVLIYPTKHILSAPHALLKTEKEKAFATLL